MFSLQSGNSGINPPYAGPYENVDVSLDSTGTIATITFTSLTKNGFIYLMGDGGSVGVNVNASSWTLGTITGSNAGTGFDPGDPYTDGGAGNEDGFGSFNQTINSFDGYGHSSDTISFTLTNTSGTWASASSVLTGNSNGQLAAAHVFVAASPAVAGANGGMALTTGFASGDGTAPPGPGPQQGIAPEPSSAALLAIGGVGLIFVMIRSRRQRMAATV
jgi:hypothetical protein